MLMDVMPNGQYAQYDDILDGEEVIGYSPSSGPNIFYHLMTLFTNPVLLNMTS